MFPVLWAVCNTLSLSGQGPYLGATCSLHLSYLLPILDAILNYIEKLHTVYLLLYKPML